MAWSLKSLFTTPKDVFKRPEENLLMLEQYLADLEARYVALSQTPAPENGALAAAGSVIARYRAYRETKSAVPAAEVVPPLPDWNEAFMAEHLLSGLMPPAQARSELARQLAALKAVDSGAFDEMSREWNSIAKPDADKDEVDKRAVGMLVSVQRATQWKNTQRWIIRRLGTVYAARLRTAFMWALGIGVLLVLFDAIDFRYGPGMALSGLGFAIAAGLLGASFSAMVGQSRLISMDNIEEARAATSKQMISLRLGVGVAAAIILYFFFESGLVDGMLFPNLEDIGFGRVNPLGTELDALRARAQELDQAADALVASMVGAEAKLQAVLALPSPDISGIDLTTIDMAATSEFEEKAQAIGASIDATKAELSGTVEALTTVRGELAEMRAEFGKGNRPLGSLAPNADLSKLVVWCFAAGFVQTLVPSLLATVTPTKPSP
jgi:hypothetical protein